MSQTPQNMDPEELLAHAGWVRGLAVALVGESRADDLAQQTMLRAMERPPRYRKNLRGWLGTIARNFAYTRTRRDSRRKELLEVHEYEGRRDFEHAAGSSALAGTPDELLGRSEAHAQLLSVLSDLPDPGRHLLLLRYFEDMTPSQIAEHHGMKPSTVRVQLMRATAELRELMKKRFGGDGMAPCVAILTPTLGKGLVLAAAVGGTAATITGSKLLVLGGILSATAVGVYLWDQLETPAVDPLIGVEATVDSNESEREFEAATVATADGVSDFSRQPVAAAPAFELIVEDQAGHRLPGASVRFHQGGESLGWASVGKDGALRIKPSREQVVMQISALDHAPELLQLDLREGRHIVVLADRGVVGGQVEFAGAGTVGKEVGSAGGLESGVRLHLNSAVQLFREESTEFDLLPELNQRYSNFRNFQVSVHEDGTFQFAGLPLGWRGYLTSADPHFRVDDRGMDSAADGRLEISAPVEGLKLRLLPVPKISGRVLLPDGVEGATLTMKTPGLKGTRALSADGCFEILADPAKLSTLELLVHTPGGYFGHYYFDSVPANGELGNLAVEHRPPAQLKVTDADGNALAGALVLDLAEDGSRTVTDADGRSQISLLGEQPSLLIRADGLQPLQLNPSLQALRVPIEVKLKAANQLHLRLQSASNQPIASPDQTLVIRLEADQGLYSGSQTLDREYRTLTGDLYASRLSDNGIVHADLRPSAQGVVSLAGLNPDATITVQVWAVGGGLLLQRELPRLAESGSQEIDLLVPASRTFHGKLIGPDGRAITDALVALRTDEAADGFLRATTDLLGRFKFPAVYGERGLLKVVAHGFAFEPDANYQLPPEGEEALIQLTTGRSLQLHVYDSAGLPVTHFKASTYVDGRGAFGSKSDANGLLKITGLPQSELDLQVEVQGWIFPVPAPLGLDELRLDLPARGQLDLNWSNLPADLQNSSTPFILRLEHNGKQMENWMPSSATLNLPVGSWKATLLLNPNEAEPSAQVIRTAEFEIDNDAATVLLFD